MRLFKSLLTSLIFCLYLVSCVTGTKKTGEDSPKEVIAPKEPPLHSLIAENNYEELSSMFNMDINVDEKDSKGRTALHIAAIKGNEQVINRLLLYGANVDAQDNDGKTPTVLSIENRQYSSSGILAENSADIHLADNSGKAASDYAMDKGKMVLEQIITEDNVNTLNSDGNAVLHTASKRGLVDVVSFLLENGADVNNMNEAEELPLDLAFENKNSLSHEKISAA